MLKKILEYEVIFDSRSRISTLEGSLQSHSDSKWISSYCLPMHTSRGSKVVLSLVKLNFGFFAKIISKGTNLEMISYPMQTAQPQFLWNNPNNNQKVASTDLPDSEQAVRIWYSTHNLPDTCFFHSVVFKPILQYLLLYTPL